MTSRTSRRLALLCVVGATAFGVTSGVANAGKPTSEGPGNCPNLTWSPLAVDPTNDQQVHVDKNDNGWICVKDIGSGTNIVDDNSHSNQ